MKRILRKAVAFAVPTIVFWLAPVTVWILVATIAGALSWEIFRDEKGRP